MAKAAAKKPGRQHRLLNEEMTMELEWRNHWTSPEWKPMKATNEREANDELARRMPYTEDGTQIRRKDTGQVLNWHPPRNEMNLGPNRDL